MNIELANCIFHTMNADAKIREVKSFETGREGIKKLHTISTFGVFTVEHKNIFVASLNPLLIRFFDSESNAVDFCLDYVNNTGIQSKLFV
jgi:hypothetical protein